jgi:hypothetical protein
VAERNGRTPILPYGRWNDGDWLAGLDDRLQHVHRVATAFRRNLLVALITALLATSLTQVAGAPTPRISVKPFKALPGDTINISGNSFAANETGTIELDELGTAVGTYAASSKGSFRTSFRIGHEAVGTHRVIAFRVEGSSRTERASATLTLVAPSAGTPDTTPAPTSTWVPSGAEVRPSPTTAPEPALPSRGATNVRAYYYLWWSARHWADKLGPSYPYTSRVLPLPADTDGDGCHEISLYVGNQLVDVPEQLASQDDVGVIADDIKAAKAAGLEGFLLNWGGNGDASQTIDSVSYTSRLVEALSVSERIGDFTNWVSYKTSTLPSPDYVIGDLAFLAREIASSSGWERVGGKPVLVLTGSRKYGYADLSRISLSARKHFYLVGDESSATLTVDRLELFDAVSYYWSSQNPWTNPASFDRLELMGDLVHAAGKQWFAPVAPGYNSRLIGGSTCVPRQDGATLRALWNGNSRSHPDGWTVISWNELAENTHFKPTTKWGDRYLRGLADLLGG